MSKCRSNIKGLSMNSGIGRVDQLQFDQAEPPGWVMRQKDLLEELDLT